MSSARKADCVSAVLFDLDGALVDTAPDLADALNATLAHYQLDALPYDLIRPIVSNGANGLIALAFGDGINADKHQAIKSHLIEHYQQNIANKSALFEGLELALDALESKNIPWGIVTNKPEYLTKALLIKLNLYERSGCVVCGDQVANPKPHPESIYLACKQLNALPENAIYIGDAERDIRAGRLAGLKTIACGYGYILSTDNINDWQADELVETSTELLELLQTLA